MAAQGGDNPYRILWRASTLGLELVGSILVAGFLGWLVDAGLGTAPIGLIVGGVIGIVGGGINFIRDAKRFASAAARVDASQKRARSAGVGSGAGSGGAAGAAAGARAERERRRASRGGGDHGMFTREEHAILPEDYEDAEAELRDERDEGAGGGETGGGRG